MTALTRQIVAIARPGVVWAVHFIAIYALISAACAARALIGHPTLLIAGAVVTVLGVALCLWSVAAPRTGEDGDLRPAAFWSGLIFALAILANASALFFFQSCGG
ncbi:hypothetical protein [Maritimibacter sp. UBA3975]|uniref:hypothetical protein n=1 Tax=Maritimibacter sp. UBA3975 TaxID=1946833 RepID=UPI000C0B4E39|nr:hypothetical protein [Maritimibacter sp. UBA3975]MAM62984.1 hypothetical protein [Maritimibacter sp.]|tara:strand:+ start:17564 stop:17878 length:315 start_codon:yes stop_codon:yes gene_type:complete